MTSVRILSIALLSTLALAACSTGEVVSRGTEEGRYPDARTASYSGQGVQSAAPVMEKGVTK